jgi:hypothetical protein
VRGGHVSTRRGRSRREELHMSTITPASTATKDDVRAAASAVIAAIDGIHQAAVELARVAESWQSPRLYHVITNEAEAIARHLEQEESEIDLNLLRREILDYLDLVELAATKSPADA